MQERDQERDAVASLMAYLQVRDQLEPLETAKSYLSKQLKGHLEANGEAALEDPETGAWARLQVREGPGELDIASMDDGEVLTAARGGLLRLAPTTVVKALRASNGRLAVIIDKFQMPSRPVMALEAHRKEA